VSDRNHLAKAWRDRRWAALAAIVAANAVVVSSLLGVVLLLLLLGIYALDWLGVLPCLCS
jgi:hypothetical protein